MCSLVPDNVCQTFKEKINYYMATNTSQGNGGGIWLNRDRISRLTAI